MSSVSRWRDSGHLERAVETAGGQQAFDILGLRRGLRQAGCGGRLRRGCQRSARLLAAQARLGRGGRAR